MAHYVCNVHAYDMLDKVVITALVTDYDQDRGYRTVHKYVTMFDGTGCDDPRDWLEDALQGLLEAL